MSEKNRYVSVLVFFIEIVKNVDFRKKIDISAKGKAIKAIL